MIPQHPPRRGLGRGLGALIPSGPPSSTMSTGVPDPLPGRMGTLLAERPNGQVHPGAPEWAEETTSGTHPESGQDEPRPAESGPPDPGHTDPAQAWFAELPIGQVRPNPRQPRQTFDADELAELVHSIREVGLLQPVVVRPAADDGYELVMGERRWRAAQQAGLAEIPAIVRRTADDDLLRDALLENLHRSQLNPLEEAAAYAQLLEDFGCTHEELAQRLGRSRPQISNTLRLMRLSPAVQRRVAAGVLSAGHARALLAVDDVEAQDGLAARVVAEGISVRGLEELVATGPAEGLAPRRPKRSTSSVDLSPVADRLADRLDTRVKVEMGRARGKLIVEFASAEDLQRIADVIDPRNRTDRPI